MSRKSPKERVESGKERTSKLAILADGVQNSYQSAYQPEVKVDQKPTISLLPSEVKPD